MKHKITILDDYQNVARDYAPWDNLNKHGHEICVITEHITDPNVLEKLLAGTTIIVAMRERTPFPRSLLERLTHLKLLVTTGMANSAIDSDAARDLGIDVCGTAGSAHAAPEHTWALLLSLARDLSQQERALRQGRWQTKVGFELAGKTLGIVGLGKIGKQVAAYATTFGMQVLAWSPNLDAQRAAQYGARKVSKTELFAQSDVVTLHLRLSDRSRGIVASKELEQLGPQGVLINTARGPLVDENALINALQTRKIRGAALDVYETEPLPSSHALLDLDNVILSPHLGYVTEQSYDKFYGGAYEDIEAWLSAKPIRLLNGL